jgi:hypothetical protein
MAITRLGLKQKINLLRKIYFCAMEKGNLDLALQALTGIVELYGPIPASSHPPPDNAS